MKDKQVGDVFYIGGPLGDDGNVLPEFLKSHPDFRPTKYTVVEVTEDGTVIAESNNCQIHMKTGEQPKVILMEDKWTRHEC